MTAQKILIIDSGVNFYASGGKLNHRLADFAADFLSRQGHEVTITRIEDQNYDLKEEVDKFVKTDVVIYQMPGWWMGIPWHLKKYIDEVFSVGYGALYESDGRTRSDPEKKYGSGGLLRGKKYLLSLTWNAPLEAFQDPKQIFEGVGIDGVYLHFHKANQFLAMEALPTFLCDDVVKAPDVEGNLKRYEEHLARVFA